MWNLEPGVSEDETVIGNLCTNTLLKLCAAEQSIQKLPKVHAIIENKTIALAIDKSVFILEKDLINPKNLEFEHEIEALSISASGDIIVCASNGHIYGIYIRGNPIFDLQLEEDGAIKNNVIRIQRDDDHSFKIFCSNGSVFLLDNIDERELNSSKMKLEENVTFDDIQLENVNLRKLPNLLSLNEVSAGYLLNYENEFLMYISGNNDYIKFEDDFSTKLFFQQEYLGIKKILDLNSYIVALTKSGDLFEICPFTRTIFNSFTTHLDYKIKDIVIVDASDDIIELLMVCEAKNNKNIWTMKIVDFPSFKIITEIDITNFTWLVEQPKSAVNLYYLNGINLNEKNLPEEIDVKIVSETQPEDRINKLIQKGHLEEAEEFGKQFGLSLQPVYKAKVRRYLHVITNTTENNWDEMDNIFLSIENTLKLIEDKNFFSEIRSIEIPNRKYFAVYLNMLLTFLDDEHFSRDILEIKEQQSRLKTLEITDPYECNRDWLKFVYHPNIAKVCCSMFNTDIAMACFVWKRHSACVMPLLNEKAVEVILNRLPASIEAFEIIQWLRCFSPTVVQVFPGCMPFLVEWCIKKTRALQMSNHWPAIGLEFIDKVLEIFENLHFLHSDFRRQYYACMEKLKNLANALQDLVTLKEGYNLTLSLDSYEKSSMDQTTLRILERVQTTVLGSVVCDFLYPIYQEKGKTPIEAIIKHIRFLVANRNGLTTWIERAVILIQLLHNEEEKLKSALLVLRSTPVPWPEAVKPLVELRNSSHELAVEINTICEMQIVEAIKIKYGWISNTTDSNMKLLYRVVKMNEADMFEDLKNLTQADPSLKPSGNVYCCYELARQNQVEKSIKFLNFLDKDQRQICSEKIINVISDILEENTLNDFDEFGYMQIFELMKSVYNFVGSEEQMKIKSIENVILIRKKFKISLNTDDLFNEDTRYHILTSSIDYLVEKLRSNYFEKSSNKCKAIELIWRDITELTNALILDKMSALIEISRRVENLNLSCALAYEALKLIECNAKNANLFVDFAILILYQQLILELDEDVRPIESSDDPMAYLIVFELLKRSLKYIRFIEIEKLLKWIRIAVDVYGIDSLKNYSQKMHNLDNIIYCHFKSNEIINNSKSSRRDSFSTFEIPPTANSSKTKTTLSDPTPVLRCLTHALLLILSQCDLNNGDGIFKKFNEYFSNTLTMGSFEILSQKFYGSLAHLIKSKQHDYWYRIAQYYCDHQKKFKLKILTPAFLLTQMKKLFRDLLAQKEPNFEIIFAMLVIENNPKQFLNELFCELRSEQQKINFFCLSERYYALINETETVVEQRKCRLKYFYFAELRRQENEQMKQYNVETMLFNELKNKLLGNILKIDLIDKFCDDFDLNLQTILIMQVTNILQKQELNFEIKLDQFQNEELIVKTNSDEILNLCQPYINKIENYKDFAESLGNFISKINPYFYELYLSVFEIIISLQIFSTQEIKKFKLFSSILIFLKNKMICKRKGRPTDLETESWLNTQKEKVTLSKIAKYRIPFSFFLNETPLDSFMKNDIDINNCESWFPLIQLYSELTNNNCKNRQDYIIITTIKRAISKNSVDFGKWQLTPVNNSFLQSVLRLLKHISDKSMILAILYSLTNNSPDGADQVEAAYECYKYAIENESDLLRVNKSAMNEDIITKIKRKYPMFKIQHLLHIYNLVEDKLLQLVENPKDLIIALYHHEVILKDRKPHINKLAKEIAEISNLELMKIQLALLEKWLEFSTESGSNELEGTFYEDLHSGDSILNSDIFTDEFVTRSYYILSSWNQKDAVSYLLDVFATGDAINAAKQLQVYECFCKLMDGSNFNLEYPEIMNLQQFIVIKCIYNLKQLGFNFTVEKFNKYDKLVLLKKIWQNYADNSLAMEIIANICVSFNIHVPKIWNGVLKQMVNFNMLKELDALIELLSCNQNLLHIEGLKIAWQYILRAPFKHANRTRSLEQEELLSKNLFRIQGCPLVDQLNLLEIAEDSIRLDRPHIAAVLLGLCNPNQKNLIKMLVKNHSNKQLKSDILELTEFGILQSIINNVLKELDL